MKVHLVAAITADGFIGKNEADLSTRWTSKEDARYFRDFSKRVEHIVLGSKTFQTFNRRLAGRKFYVYSRKSELKNEYQNEAELVSKSPQDFVADMQQKGIEEVMVAGGASIYTQFMQAGVVTDVYLTVEPVFFGSGVKLFSEELDIEIELTEVIDLSDQTKVLHFKVK